MQRVIENRQQNKKYTIRLSFRIIIALLLLLGALVYVGTIAGYDYFAIYCFCVFCVTFLYAYNHHEIVRKRAQILLLAGIYIFIFALLKNYPLSIRNLPIIYLCFLLMCIKTVEREKTMVFRLIGLCGLLFAVITIMLNINPGVFSSIVLNITGGNSDTVVIAGLGGEVSANAFVMSVGCVSYMGELLVSEKRNSKIVKIIAISVIYYGIFLTDKRSFMLMVPAVFLALFMIYMWFSDTTKRTLFIVAVVPILLIIYLVFFQNAVSNLLSDNSGTGINLNGRDALWAIAFRMIQQHPLLGNGLRSYDVHFNAYYSNNWTFAGAHNAYIQYAAEMGLVFTVIFFGVCFKQLANMIVTYSNMIKEKYPVREISSLLVAVGILLIIFIYGLSGNSFNNPQQMLTGAIAASVGIELVHKYKTS